MGLFGGILGGFLAPALLSLSVPSPLLFFVFCSLLLFYGGVRGGDAAVPEYVKADSLTPPTTLPDVADLREVVSTSELADMARQLWLQIIAPPATHDAEHTSVLD